MKVFDSWGGELSKNHFEKFSLPYLAKIAAGVKQQVAAASAKDRKLPARIPMTIFARNAHHALEKLGNTEYDVISLDWYDTCLHEWMLIYVNTTPWSCICTFDRGIEPDQARHRLLGSNKSLQGNLDPCTLYGTPETIRSEVGDMLKKFGTQKYIANLGHGMLPSMDPDHAQVFITSVQDLSLAMNSSKD